MQEEPQQRLANNFAEMRQKIQTFTNEWRNHENLTGNFPFV